MAVRTPKLDFTTKYCATRFIAWILRHEGRAAADSPKYLAYKLRRAFGRDFTQNNVKSMLIALDAALHRSLNKKVGGELSESRMPSGWDE